MTKDQIETLVRLVEDIGFAMAAFEAFKTPQGCPSSLFDAAVEKLKASHSAIATVFSTEGEEA